MSFREKHSSFYTLARMQDNTEAMSNWLKRRFPRTFRLGGHTGDWGMGSSTFTLHLPEPDPRVGWTDGMAISHYMHENNPVGFNPHLMEFMQIDIDVNPYMLRQLAQHLTDYANELDGVQASPGSTESDETPESE